MLFNKSWRYLQDDNFVHLSASSALDTEEEYLEQTVNAYSVALFWGKLSGVALHEL